MGVLDKVFAGKKGIVNVLAKTLGGTATIIYSGERIYNEETDTYTETTSSVTVPFIPITKESTKSPSEDFVFDANTIAGTIPCSALPQTPAVDRDTITYQGKTCVIKYLRFQNVGDVPVSIEVIAK